MQRINGVDAWIDDVELPEGTSSMVPAIRELKYNVRLDLADLLDMIEKIQNEEIKPLRKSLKHLTERITDISNRITESDRSAEIQIHRLERLHYRLERIEKVLYGSWWGRRLLRKAGYHA